MPQPTTVYFPPIVEDTVHTMTEGILTTVKASLDVQQTLVESTLSVIRAGFGANKLAVEQWLALSNTRQQPSLLGVLENGVQTWVNVAQRTMVAAEQTTEQAVDRVSAEAERAVAEEAQTPVRQREQERVEPRRLEQQQRERADEHQVVEHSTINVVKREDDWAVIRDNASRASATFDTKREAVERARELAQRSGADLHIEKAPSAHTEQAQPPERAVDEPAAPPAINVVKREDDWAVVRENATRPSGTFDTKREAVKRARELAERSGADLHVETAKGGQSEHNGQG